MDRKDPEASRGSVDILERLAHLAGMVPRETREERDLLVDLVSLDPWDLTAVTDPRERRETVD